MAYHWVQSGMESVFFQDGNSLLMPPDQLTDVLEYLNARFPPDPAASPPMPGRTPSTA